MALNNRNPWRECPVMPGPLTGTRSHKQAECEESGLDSACEVRAVQVAPGIIHSPTHREQHPLPQPTASRSIILKQPSLFVHWSVTADRPPCSSANFP